MNVTKCAGNGQGSCKRCLDNGCVKEILKDRMEQEVEK